MNMPHRHETGFYGQQALFGRDLQPNPNALPPELRPEAQPAYAADGTTPYIEQTGGEHTYDAEADITGEEAAELARQGLGGRRIRREASRYEDRLHDGTADAHPQDLTDEQVWAAHEAYVRVSEALAHRYETKLRQQEDAGAAPQGDDRFPDYATPRPNPSSAMIRARTAKSAARRAAMRRPKDPHASGF